MTGRVRWAARARDQYGSTQTISESLRDFAFVATNAHVADPFDSRVPPATALFRKNVEAIVRSDVRAPVAAAPAGIRGTALVLAEMGEFAEGIVRGQESIRIAESIEQPLNLTAATSGLGRLYYRKGDLERAVPVLRRALELSRTWNLRIWFPQVATALGSCYSAMGRLTDALPLLEEAVGVGGAAPWRPGTGPDGLRGALLEGKFAQSSETPSCAARGSRTAAAAEAWRGLGEVALCRPDARLHGTSSPGPRAHDRASTCDLSAHCYFDWPRPSMANDHPPPNGTGDGSRSIPEMDMAWARPGFHGEGQANLTTSRACAPSAVSAHDSPSLAVAFETGLLIGRFTLKDTRTSLPLG